MTAAINSSRRHLVAWLSLGIRPPYDRFAQLTSFGDMVHFKELPHALQAQVAGLEGVAYGFTISSVADIKALGSLAGDFTLNVETLKDFFGLDDLDLVGHRETMEISVAEKTIRISQKDGNYTEVTVGM